MPTTHDVFLSHSSADKPAVEDVAHRLRNEANLHPFLDSWHLVPGESWIPALERAISTSRSVAVFIGPKGMGAWHDEEKQLALVYSVQRRNLRVIPVLLSGARSQDVEGFLRTKTWVDLAEPDGFARLVAGITGQAPELVASLEPGPDVGRRIGVLARIRGELVDFTLERSRHEGFFGRTDILDEIDQWLSAHERGWLLVMGGPGLGKSAILNEWLRQREQAERLTAVHFIRPQSEWDQPEVIRANLSAQIEWRFPELHDDEDTPANRLERLLTRLLPVLEQRDDQLVLLVDGLDEAMALGGRNPLPDIFPIEVPPRVFVVTASRPRYPHLRWLELRGGPSTRIDLDERAASNEAAVHEYWHAMRERTSPPLPDRLVQVAVERAEGNLLHAVKLHQQWHGATERSEKDVPTGFEGMLALLWQRIGELPEGRWQRVHTGLSLLCAAREGLPLAVIENLLEWGEGRAKHDFLPYAREMLHEERWHEHPAYRLFHEGFRELVSGELPRAVGEHHRRLACFAAWPLEGDAFRRSYALRHRVAHLVAAGHVDDATKCVMDVGYLTAKACAEGAVAIERDIRLAAEVCEDGETCGRLTTLGHLVAASAHWANEVPQALPALLHDRALTNAPELIGTLVGLDHALLEHPRLRHPLQARGTPRILHGHRRWVTALAVLPDGRLVSGSLDGTVRVWDVQTGRTLAILDGHPRGVRTVAVTPKGHVVFDADETIYVRDVATGAAVATLEGHQDTVVTLVVFPDGRIVSSSANHEVRVWDLHTGSSVAFHARGVVKAFAVLSSNRLVSGTLDGIVQVWDVQTGHASHTLEGATGAIIALAVSPDGRIVFGASEGKILMWDTATGRILATIDEEQGSVTALAALPNDRLVAATGDALLRVWDVETRQTVANLRGHQSPLTAVAVLSDGRVVSGSSDATIRVWDIDAEHVTVHPGHQDWVNAVAVLPDGRVVSGSDDRTLRVWDAQTGRLLDTFHDPQLVVKSLAVLPDGRFVSGSWDAKLRVWSTEERQPLATLRQSGWVSALAVLPDGRVVSGSHDHTLRIWDMTAERALATLRGHTDSVHALAALPNGRVVSGSDDQTVRVWDVQTGRAVATLEGHTGRVRALAVLPDGRVVSGSDDETVRVWDVLTERLIATFHGHTDSVNALAVLPDGRIVSGLHDNTMRVWDVATGRTLVAVYGDAAFLSVACVDQHLVVAGDAAGNVWFIDLPDLPRA